MDIDFLIIIVLMGHPTACDPGKVYDSMACNVGESRTGAPM